MSSDPGPIRIELARSRQGVAPAAGAAAAPAKFAVRGLDFHYGDTQVLHEVSLDIPLHRVTAIIGPSGCGKSTLLRVLNRIYSIYPRLRASGEVLLDGENVLDRAYALNRLRSKVGMVFQKPVPFPLSIHDNIAWGIRHHERLSRPELQARVEQALRRAALWVARAIALRPEVLLLDEPTSALDPVATARIEQLIEELKGDYTLVMVTHNMQQAARVSDRTAFMYMGRLVEVDATETIFTSPSNRHTEDYITGRFG